MTDPVRRLVLMRHAKAEAYADEDRARRLTDRGQRDAAEAGMWLAAHDVVPDHALVSSAARTRETWEHVSRGLRAGASVVLDDALYAAGPETALDVIRAAEPTARTLLVLGHNPTIAYLAHALDDGEADEDAFRTMSEGYPTAALTILDVPVAWADLGEGTARIAAFHVGNGTAVV